MMITSPFSTTIDNGNDFGLHVDDDDQTIRLIQPEIWQKSQQLQELINLFLEKNDDFKKIVSTFVQSLNDVGEMIEREKIKAIGSRSLIKALEMKRDSLREQYRNMIREKKIELERFVTFSFWFQYLLFIFQKISI
ncbi:Intraflagellar transport protein 20, variant 2 [Dermatophagoides farinae]|uniref:Intraflagellar transport protein 20, variant 2 n=1 Tax=Dermatophagoides farinae TaxID=6954 RepID=A0A922HV46_DERFA|nr:Intraflagellar transport protein 20, variant 2 [Dermatophagoides farinae]